MSELQLPGQMAIEAQHLPGLLAQPTAAIVNVGGTLRIMMVGGLTKTEHVAAMLLAEWGMQQAPDSDSARIDRALDVSEKLLARSAERMQARQEDAAEPPVSSVEP